MRQGPPLPIPNREVKPARADDTAIPGGKVGRRQLYKLACPIYLRQAFFVPLKQTDGLVETYEMGRSTILYIRLSHLFGQAFLFVTFHVISYTNCIIKYVEMNLKIKPKTYQLIVRIKRIALRMRKAKFIISFH